MDKSLQDYFKSIEDLTTWDQFKKEISKKKEKYDGLFDDITIANIIIDKMGRNKEGFVKINDLHPGIECSISGTITSLSEPKTFTRKNNTQGRLVSVILTDETGSVPVILWNENVRLIETQKIQVHSMVTIINGYTKKGYHGVEMNVGNWSQIEISEQKNNTLKTSDQLIKANCLKGKIQTIQPTTVFFRDDGTEGFISKITLKTQKKTEKIILWDEQVKNLQQFSIGDEICITNADFKMKNGENEIHVNGRATIKRL